MVLDISCQQFGGIYLGGLYMLIMDISCQHLGDDCKLKGFLCALRAQSWGIYIFENYHFIGYKLSTIYLGGLYMLTMDISISCQLLGDACKLKGFLCALRAQSWVMNVFEK